jgi:hypothetical protein
LREAPGYANLNLNLDSLTLEASTLTMPQNSGVTVNMDLDELVIEADQGIGAANAMLKVNADRIRAQASAGDVFLEISGSSEVRVDVQTVAGGTASIGAAQDLLMSTDSRIVARNLSLSANRDLYLNAIQADGALSLQAGRHMALSGAFSGATLSLGSTSGTVSQSAGSTFVVSGASVLSAGAGAVVELNNANQFAGGITVRGAGTVRATDVDALAVTLDSSGSASVASGGNLTVQGTASGASSHVWRDHGGRSAVGEQHGADHADRRDGGRWRCELHLGGLAAAAGG